MNKHSIPRSTTASSRSLLTIALVVLFASTLVFASNTPQGTFDKTLQVSGPVDLEVLTHSGDVTVRAGGSLLKYSRQTSSRPWKSAESFKKMFALTT